MAVIKRNYKMSKRARPPGEYFRHPKTKRLVRRYHAHGGTYWEDLYLIYAMRRWDGFPRALAKYILRWIRAARRQDVLPLRWDRTAYLYHRVRMIVVKNEMTHKVIGQQEDQESFIRTRYCPYHGWPGRDELFPCPCLKTAPHMQWHLAFQASKDMKKLL